jgi:hypothetical protein
LPPIRFTAIRLPVQAKLKLGAIDDPLEHEADRVAERVARLPAAGIPGETAHPKLRHSTADAAREHGFPHIGGKEVPANVHEVLRSSGQPLDAATRAQMEPRFGHDFSGVRVHSDPTAAQTAHDMNARAYTMGDRVVFAAGQFAPGTSDGRRLLAHELTHVVQQSGGVPAVQCAPAADTRWNQNANAARYRGQLMARRIRAHGKLSKEARAKINDELAHFEGAAKTAYLREVEPVLRSVIEIEMPAESAARPVLPPHSMTWSLVAADPRGVTDAQLDAPITEARQRQDAEAATELAAAQVRETDKLDTMTSDWLPDDRAFARELLNKVIGQSVNIDPRAVSDSDYQPILDRYERWMRAVDQQRMAECATNPPGWVKRVRARFSGDKPCVSWFSDEETPGRTHAESALHALAMQLKTYRGAQLADGSTTPADVVQWDVFLLRKETDPVMLAEAEMASEMVSGVVGAADAIGAKVNAPKATALVPDEPGIPGAKATAPVPKVPAPPAPRGTSPGPMAPTEQVPASSGRTPTSEGPAGTAGGPTQKLLDSKPRTITSDIDPRSAKVARRTNAEPQTVYEVKKASADPDIQAEVRMGEHLADDGHVVHFNAEGADLTVDGVRTDVKHVRSARGVDSAIERVRNQAPQVAIDGTSVGLSESEAVSRIRAFEQNAAERPAKYQNLDTVYVLLGDGKVYVYHRTAGPLKVERIGAGGTGLPR